MTLADLMRFNGLFVGQLRIEELEAFDDACAAGHAHYSYEGPMGFMGCATVRFSPPTDIKSATNPTEPKEKTGESEKLPPMLQIMRAFARTGAIVQDDALVEFQEAVAAALSALSKEVEEARGALRAAHQVAVDRAFERDRCGQPDGKMQGATAACIANDILAIMFSIGLSPPTVGKEETGSDEG